MFATSLNSELIPNSRKYFSVNELNTILNKINSRVMIDNCQKKLGIKINLGERRGKGRNRRKSRQVGVKVSVDNRDARRYYHGGQRQCKQALVAIRARQNVVPSTGKLHSTRRARYDPVGRAITFRLLPPLTLRHQRDTQPSSHWLPLLIANETRNTTRSPRSPTIKRPRKRARRAGRNYYLPRILADLARYPPRYLHRPRFINYLNTV